MPDAEAALDQIAAERADDPLKPVTVIAPSHAAALQLRRRLAGRGAFAGVRFEPLARIAELLAAADLAASGRAPLARPIGDYLAGQIARETRDELSSVRDFPGYARVLRQIFARLRRGGIRTPEDVAGEWAGHFGEILRLYGVFRTATAAFYDREDLLDAAADAVAGRRAGFLTELGQVLVFSSAVQSAGASRLVDAIAATTTCTTVGETKTAPTQRFVLAPDAASEVREVVREVVRALGEGIPLDDIAVLHGAEPAYAGMLQEVFEQAGVPAASLPGRSLLETAAGRGLLGLIELPGTDYSRAATMDALGIAPLRGTLPGGGGERVRANESAWDRISRAARVTHGLTRWQSGLQLFVAEREADLADPDAREDEARRRLIEMDAQDGRLLGAVVEELGARLERLRVPQAADNFCRELRAILHDYFDPGATGIEEVIAEVDQLGTIAAVGGTFTLETFAVALRANLEVAHISQRRLGEGVLIADYRMVDGMRFRRVILCGAREGAFPQRPGEEPLVDDGTWTRLRESHPYIEDLALRSQRAERAAECAVASASEVLTWCAPLYEAAGSREHYPAPRMVAAARTLDDRVRNGSLLRTHAETPWLRRGSSPLSLRLQGTPVDIGEIHLREAVLLRQQGKQITPAHRRWRVVAMARARAGSAFSAWDGNVADVAVERPLAVRGTVSPTSLENYCACGFRYFGRSILGLRGVEEPEERDLMDAATRGTLVHKTLETFFRDQRARGRPAAGEAWADADRETLLGILDEQLAAAEARGMRGLNLFASHERRTLRADLTEFLEADSAFRLDSGAVPAAFEVPIPDTVVSGLQLRGIVDRIDRSADGREAWVIDYKTGS